MIEIYISFKRNSRNISENKYKIDIYFYTFEEDEVIRKIMSLGPYVKVKSPDRVRDIVIHKIKRALMLETTEIMDNINELS